jgi:hypothetical protein
VHVGEGEPIAAKVRSVEGAQVDVDDLEEVEQLRRFPSALGRGGVA